MLATTVNPTMTPTGNLRMSMPPIKRPIVAQGCARPVRSWRVSWASRPSYLFGLLGYCSAPAAIWVGSPAPHRQGPRTSWGHNRRRNIRHVPLLGSCGRLEAGADPGISPQAACSAVGHNYVTQIHLSKPLAKRIIQGPNNSGEIEHTQHFSRSQTPE